MALADEEADVRLAAATALGWSGFADDADSLLLALDDSSQRVQAAAIKSIGKRNNPASFERVAAFVGNPSGMLRIAAMQSLVQIDPEKAVAVLSIAATDKDEEVARVASNLLDALSERS
jgi:HEAT repeat protein